MEMVEEIAGNVKRPVGICIDLHRAFETKDYNMLLRKLEKYAITVCYDW